MIPFPNIRQITDQAENDVPCAKLLRTAIALLLTHPEYISLTQEQTYQKLIDATKEVYRK